VVTETLWLEDRPSGDGEEAVQLTVRFNGLESLSFFFFFHEFGVIGCFQPMVF
jgi:hypothetical protein